MSGWTIVGVGLSLAGALLGAPGLILVGGLTIVSRWMTTFWSRFGLDSIAFERRLGSRHALWGDEVPLDLVVWNRKPLPVPLLVVDDAVSDRLRVRGHALEPSDRPGRGNLRNAWSLLWYEQVIRHLTIEARRRGTFAFGPVRLTVSDLFERGTRSEERELPATLVVRPRTVPVRAEHPAAAPLGAARTRASLFEDPARFAGVRAYQAGDPMRRIHWRATARLGAPVSRRFEPVRERSVLITLDLQTVPGAHWLMVYDDDAVEGLCVAAASLARRALRDDAACGLAVNAQVGGDRGWGWVAPASGPGQLARIEDALAQLQPIVTLPFTALLRAVPRLVAPGATILALGARDPLEIVPTLRQLERSGYRVTHIRFGDRTRDEAGETGIRVRTARLDPSWRTADALVVGR